MKRVWLILLVVLVVLCGGGMFALTRVLGSMRKPPAAKDVVVERGNLIVSVVESGTVDAVKVVEIKSRVAGRVKKLWVEEGDEVSAGQLIATIDPQETELRVEQDEAQLRGAQAGVARATIEIEQRRVLAKTALEKARARLAQLEKELQIQPTLTKSSIESAQTAYNSAVQTRDLLVNTSQLNERTQTQNAVDEANTNYEQAKREFDRQKGLRASGYVADRDVELARQQLDLAQTRLQGARDRLGRLDGQQDLERRQAEERVRQAKADLDRAMANRIQDDVKRKEYETAVATVREAEIGLRDVEVLQKGRAQGQATVDQLRSVVNDSRRQLGETEIRAPIAGVIAKRLIQEGELVSSLSSFSSGTPIVRLEDRRRMIVKLDINEIDAAKLKLGMKAKVDVDALPDDTMEGQVTKIAPASKIAAAATGAQPVVKFEVEVTLDKSQAGLKSGMSAKCTMDTLRIENVLRVPVEYLGQDTEGAFLMIKPDPKKKDAKATREAVVPGVRTNTFVEIKSGATEGQKLEKPAFTGPKRRGAFGGPND